MGKMIDYAGLRKQYESEPGRACTQLLESMEAGHLKPSDFSLRGLFESLVEDGRAFLDYHSLSRKSGRSDVTLMEAANATDLSAFSNITGQIVFAEVKQGLENPEFLYPKLFNSEKTPFPYGERIPGVGKVGDKMDYVGEGEEYPTAGPNEEYIDIPATVKSGLIVNVTREAVEYDLTGKVLGEANNLGYSHGLKLEKKGLSVVTGVTNSYKRNGVATNTYLTTGAYINALASGNTLTDWTSIQTLELLFDAITDPNTGEPVVLQAASLLVPSALKRTAERILGATGIRYGDGASNTTAAYGANPMDKGFYGTPRYNILSNAYVKSITSDATKWFFGDFKKAFKRKYAWDKEVVQAADNNEMKFTRDIWARTKVSTRDVVGVWEPRYVASSKT